MTTLSLARTIAAPPEERVIADAYVYLMGRTLVIRQEHTDLRLANTAYNQIRCNPLGSADFVNPNFDVAYLEAWFAVDPFTPVLLTVPEITGRYYTVQLLDEWGEVIANINERVFPSKPYGAFALVYPGSHAGIPSGATRIELHSAKAKMLARVELKDDPPGAVRLQHGFQAASLGRPDTELPPDIPDFTNSALPGAELFDYAEVILSSALDVSPIAAQLQQQVYAVARYAASGTGARKTLDRLIRDKVAPEFKDYAVSRSAPNHNNWMGGARTGNYGRDFRLRTAVNLLGIWANTNDEVVYFMASRDGENQLLNGSCNYVIYFPAQRLPQMAVNAYWSVILVSVPDYRVVPNALNRFNFNSYSPLQKETDGSLKIGIGPDLPPGIKQSNWLSSPAGKVFSLTFRCYVPKDNVHSGDWAPPAVTRLPG